MHIGFKDLQSWQLTSNQKHATDKKISLFSLRTIIVSQKDCW